MLLPKNLRIFSFLFLFNHKPYKKYFLLSEVFYCFIRLNFSILYVLHTFTYTHLHTFTPIPFLTQGMTETIFYTVPQNFTTSPNLVTCRGGTVAQILQKKNFASTMFFFYTNIQK